MKTVLLSIIGQPRTYDITTIFLIKNLIEPNKDRYNFKIIFNTQLDDIYYNKDDFENSLKNIFLEYSLNIQYFETTYNNTVHGIIKFLNRINNVCISESHNSYDFYIFLRTDTIIKKLINLDNFNINDFSIISDDLVYRNGEFLKRDFDIMYIAGRSPLYTFLYPFTIVFKERYQLDSIEIFKDTNFEYIYKYYDTLKNRDLTDTEINNINTKFDVDGAFESGIWKALHILLINNYGLYRYNAAVKVVKYLPW